MLILSLHLQAKVFYTYPYPYDTALYIGAQHLLSGTVTRLGNEMSHRRGIPFLRRLHEKVIFAEAIPGVSQIAFRCARGIKNTVSGTSGTA